MESPSVDALAEALAAEGWWHVFVRQTEDGEQYVELAASAQSQEPIETIWFEDDGTIVWGDEYEYTVQLTDPRDAALAILYTTRDY